MDKSEEMQRLSVFVDSIQDCPYLADYMREMVPQIESAIQSDMCCPSFSDLMRGKREMLEEVKQLQIERNKLESEVKILMASAKRAREELDAIRNAAKRLSQF